MLTVTAQHNPNYNPVERLEIQSLKATVDDPEDKQYSGLKKNVRTAELQSSSRHRSSKKTRSTLHLRTRRQAEFSSQRKTTVTAQLHRPPTSTWIVELKVPNDFPKSCRIHRSLHQRTRRHAQLGPKINVYNNLATVGSRLKGGSANSKNTDKTPGINLGVEPVEGFNEEQEDNPISDLKKSYTVTAKLQPPSRYITLKKKREVEPLKASNEKQEDNPMSVTTNLQQTSEPPKNQRQTWALNGAPEKSRKKKKRPSSTDKSDKTNC
ncbi:unnamed protein product [Caenorhabditis auriculariae]|uniref:Uncharacterized protein n=1 Tax=Caenorhabditis auriculariae TaxID=2777116 RepID=A0A8S1HFN8_9PELO|nr:unnamed protein product [Caenorhabditis auriculariae]